MTANCSVVGEALPFEALVHFRFVGEAIFSLGLAPRDAYPNDISLKDENFDMVY